MIIYVSGNRPIPLTLKELNEIFMVEARRIFREDRCSRTLALEAMREFLLAHGPRGEKRV